MNSAAVVWKANMAYAKLYTDIFSCQTNLFLQYCELGFWSQGRDEMSKQITDIPL